MAEVEPETTLDARYSSEAATATPWAEGRRALAEAGVGWLSTVRPDGRPHVTPLLTVWLDGALHFTTGPAERKAGNLERNPHRTLTTGCNALDEGSGVKCSGRRASRATHPPTSPPSALRTTITSPWCPVERSVSPGLTHSSLSPPEELRT
jgi:hypothetical protein